MAECAHECCSRCSVNRAFVRQGLSSCPSWPLQGANDQVMLCTCGTLVEWSALWPCSFAFWPSAETMCLCQVCQVRVRLFVRVVCPVLETTSRGATKLVLRERTGTRCTGCSLYQRCESASRAMYASERGAQRPAPVRPTPTTPLTTNLQSLSREGRPACPAQHLSLARSDKRGRAHARRAGWLKQVFLIACRLRDRQETAHLSFDLLDLGADSFRHGAVLPTDPGNACFRAG